MSEYINVCVIEDNFSIRKLFATLLKKSGLLTIDFNNAKEAIEWLRVNKTDIILLDILMPELNGIDAIKLIRGIPGLEKVPVIAVTGFASDTDRDKYMNTGFNGYMTKPVNVTTFAQDIKEFINQLIL